jgi:osmoprotectant transport system permease protein
MNLMTWLSLNYRSVLELTVSHLWLTLLPTVIGLLVALPLGYIAHHVPRLNTLIVGGTSLFYTIPSLALFILLPKVLGTKVLDPVNVVVALVIYTVALLTRVVDDGLSAVPEDAVRSAQGMGFTRAQSFFRVELPIAVPTVISGLRVVVVSNISIVTMAAVIGIAQLGSLFTMGFTRRLFPPIVVGLVVCLVLALILDRLLYLLGSKITPWVEKEAA